MPITNGPAGVGPGGGGPQLRATALPAPIALAATWDPEAARQYGKLAGEETLALGSVLLEAPDINAIVEYLKTVPRPAKRGGAAQSQDGMLD